MTEAVAGQVAILISGRGSNARALIEAAANGFIAGRISQVISDRADAPGLATAKRRGVPARTIAASAFDSSADFEKALAAQLGRTSAGRTDVVALAGFMRVLSAEFVRRFDGRIVNVHPSLLPAYKGLDTHRRVLAAGEVRHGCSVHFVTAKLDAGPVIAQAEIAVTPDDTPETLAARVLREEHRIYPRVVALCCSGRITMRGGRCLLDGRAMRRPLTPDEAARGAVHSGAGRGR